MKLSIAASAFTAALVTETAVGLLGLDIYLGISHDDYLCSPTNFVIPGYQMCSKSEYTEVESYQINNNFYVSEKETSFTQCSTVISQNDGVAWSSYMNYLELSDVQGIISFPNIQVKIDAVLINTISTINTEMVWSFASESSFTANVAYCLSLSDGSFNIELNVWLSAGGMKPPGNFWKKVTILQIEYEVFVLSSPNKLMVATYVMVGVSVTSYQGDLKPFVDNCLVDDHNYHNYELVSIVAGTQVMMVKQATFSMTKFEAKLAFFE